MVSASDNYLNFTISALRCEVEVLYVIIFEFFNELFAIFCISSGNQWKMTNQNICYTWIWVGLKKQKNQSHETRSWISCKFSAKSDKMGYSFLLDNRKSLLGIESQIHEDLCFVLKRCFRNMLIRVSYSYE